MSRRPPETQWRFVQNIRPRPWSAHNRREVHDLDNEKEECELDEDFGFGNLNYLRIENTLEALTIWLDDHLSYNPCPQCLYLPEHDNTIIEPEDYRILFHVDRKRLVQLLLDMVAIPSLTFEEGPLATYLAHFLAEIGLDVELQQVEDPAGSGLESQQPIARWPGSEDGPTVLLISHMDHHPIVNGWDRPPFQGQVEGGWVYGCGTQDGKGGIAAMIMAIMALKGAGVSLKGNVILAPVMAHKRASLGTHSLLEAGLCADWAIDVKNTDLNIVTIEDLERLLPQMETAQVALRMEVQNSSGEVLTIPPFVGLKDSRLVRTLKKWHKCLVRQKPVIGAETFLGEISDGHLTAQAGIPTVVYGPGSVRAFEQWPTANERIWIEDVVMTANIIALAVRDLLS